jgi:hypothetical protein
MSESGLSVFSVLRFSVTELPIDVMGVLLPPAQGNNVKQSYAV